jgi:hypothetical protein
MFLYHFVPFNHFLIKMKVEVSGFGSKIIGRLVEKIYQLVSLILAMKMLLKAALYPILALVFSQL